MFRDSCAHTNTGHHARTRSATPSLRCPAGSRGPESGSRFRQRVEWLEFFARRGGNVRGTPADRLEAHVLPVVGILRRPSRGIFEEANRADVSIAAQVEPVLRP